jgi:ABC-2 type transport system permease protein
MTGILEAFRIEFYRIFTVKPIFAVLIMGVAIYALYYPQPYLNEALRDVPIAVVDRDGTQASRDFARLVDATSDVAVLQVLPDLASAERQVYARRVDGILVIPQYFERELLHGRPSPVALYADASYFLIYQRVAGAISAVAQTVGAGVEAARLVAIGVDPAIAVAASNPMPLTAVPLFNPEGGYATYILPAAFVLLLQQILLMGVGLLNSMSDTDHGNAGRGRLSPIATMLGKLLAYLTLQAVVLGLGFVVAGVFRKPIRVQLILAAAGLPLFMVAGFSWPSEAIPPAIKLLSYVVPSTSAIDGFVKLSQLGAPLSAVNSEFLILWALAIFYNLFALLLAARDPASTENTAKAVPVV